MPFQARVVDLALHQVLQLPISPNYPLPCTWAQPRRGGGGDVGCDSLGGTVDSLALYLLNHVVYDMAVLLLGAEHHDLRVFVDLYIVPGWPVKEIVRIDCFLFTIRVRRRELSAQEEAPVRTLTQITIQSLEQGRGINACRETEILTTDLA